MPLTMNVPAIVTEVLQETGVLPAREQFTNALETNGVNVESLAKVLAYLIISGKESTKLKALQMALSAYGIELQSPKVEDSRSITVNIQVNGNLQNNLFAPERSTK